MPAGTRSPAIPGRRARRTAACARLAFTLTALLCAHAARAAPDLVELGRALFFDTDLSGPRTQACATCHDPARAFTDSRRAPGGGAVSLGADGRSLGDRNTPTLTYAALIPPLAFDAELGVSGGLFLDGRAPTLESQVAGPLLCSLEMGQPDFAAVVARVIEKPEHRDGLAALFGADVLGDPAGLEAAIVAAVAAYERSAELITFDSRYDRFLAGEIELTEAEQLGRALFFSDLTNCAQCHLNDPARISTRETFTNYRYHNIGVPANAAARRANGRGTAYRDLGLAANGAVAADSAEEAAGRFRVPTLRNVAVTGPYMHNGAFAELDTAVFFYGKYLVNNTENNTNPETGLPWEPPEIEATVDRKLLRLGQPLDRERAALIAAFLRTLTDRRYESLLAAPERSHAAPAAVDAISRAPRVPRSPAAPRVR